MLACARRPAKEASAIHRPCSERLVASAAHGHHPDELEELMRHFLGGEVQARPPSVAAAEQAAQALRMQGCRVPTWESLLREGASPPTSEGEGAEDTSRRGWQKLAGAAVDKRALEMLFADLDNASRALLLSQSGEGASCVLPTVRSCPEFDVPNNEYRVVLPRRLRLPLPLTPQRCRCGGRLDALGDHRSACAQVGVLAHRAGPLERAAARICREAGAQVATHVALHDMNLDAPATDGRRLEVVANGLHVWRGAQVAVDTTLVSPLQRDGQPRPRGRGWRCSRPRRANTARTLNSWARGVRCRFAVLGMEVGGRISSGASAFLRRLARAGAKQRAACSAPTVSAQEAQYAAYRCWLRRRLWSGKVMGAGVWTVLQEVGIDWLVRL